MNKAEKLFDPDYIKKTYRKKILAKLPQFKTLDNIEIREHKKQMWDTTYHIVVEYFTTFKTVSGEEKNLSIFCSAHSSEPRKNVYVSMKFLAKHGFNDNNPDKLTAPLPLFYSNYFHGTFYVGVDGHNLYHYIKLKKKELIEDIVAQAAAWFARLHSLPVTEAINFNKDNSRIKTVKPGMKEAFEKIQAAYPQYYEKYKTAFTNTNEAEKKFLASTEQRWLVHGDAHPENIIKMSGGRLAIIDFTDLCLSDFARDLGSFLQQLEFKIMRRIGDQEYADKVKRIFLDNYLKNAKIEMTPSLQNRITTYYNWTMLRTAGFFLIKHHPMPDRAEQLLNAIK